MTNCAIALIVEDETDFDTVRTIVHRVLGENTSTKKWASNGCAHLRRKLTAKLKEMSKAGCNAFVIVHDLDRNPDNGILNDETKLRDLLEEQSSQISNLDKHICIPIEEIEAWFWSDPKVVQLVGRGNGQAHPNPGLIEKPKEKLIKLSIGENRKPRYSTNMNPELAAKLALDLCCDRCLSFRNLLGFLRSLPG